MIEFTEGDMFAAPADIRINTVNCVGVMGAGVALAFKKRNPQMFKEYKSACNSGDIKPGILTEWRELGGEWIINFPTKRHWRDPSRFEDVELGLDALRKYLEPLGSVRVALPALGCGHGGLDWDSVSKLISEKLSGLDARIAVYAPADSRKAGRKISEEPSDSDLRETKALGFYSQTQNAKTIFAIGNENIADAKKWLAILPSRQPSERELAALNSVAQSIASTSNPAVVALIYQNKVSEKIMDIFAQSNVATLAIAPFGVLTRPSLKEAAGKSKAVISLAPPTKKWSHSILADAFTHLREKASAVLISDPEPHWVIKHSSDWQNLPLNFVRYEEMTKDTLTSLTEMGSKPIGRRGVEALLGNPSNPQNGQKTDAQELKLDMSEFSPEVWRTIVSILRDSSPEKWAMTVKMNNPTVTAEIEERIDRLRDSKNHETAY